MSFQSITRIGLPTVLGISLLSIPTALNETKPSRSFYEQDDDLILSPLLETTEILPSNAETEVKSTFIDGYKINSSSFLEKQLHTLRSSTIDKLALVDAELNNLTGAFKNEVKNLYADLDSVYDPKDQFLPSFIYALTSTLTGSILVNQRSLPVRFLSPLVFAGIGFKVFLPGTFDNTIDAIKNWEAHSYPELLNYQRSLRSFLIQTEQQVCKANQDMNDKLVSTIHEIRRSLTK